MNLKDIEYSINKKPVSNERELLERVVKYCILNKIDFIEFSTIGFNYFGSRINSYSTGEFYSEPFGRKKETIVDTNKRLSEYIKDNVLSFRF